MCFSFGWIVQALITLVLICGVVAIFNIWVSPLLASLPGGARVVATLRVIFAVIVCIVAIVFLVDLLACVAGGPRGTILR